MLWRELRLAGVVALAVSIGVLNIVAATSSKPVSAAPPVVDGPTPTTATSTAVAVGVSKPDGAARGRQLFHVKGCAVCHVEIGAGPRLSGVVARSANVRPGLDAAAYIRESITDPDIFKAAGGSTTMPKLNVSPSELDALVSYVLTL